MPGNFSAEAARRYGVSTNVVGAPGGPQYQGGYIAPERGEAGFQMTTVPPELRYEGETFAQSWVQHAQAAASVLPAVVHPAGTVIAGLSAQSRNEAREQAAVQAQQAQEAREKWATGFQAFGTTLAASQATFGRELAALRAMSGGTSATYFLNPFPTSRAWTFPTFNSLRSAGATRLTQALRRGRRILTLEDL